jgi:serine/threonine protein kinase
MAEQDTNIPQELTAPKITESSSTEQKKQLQIEASVPQMQRKIIASKFKNELHIVDSEGKPLAESKLEPSNVLGAGDTALVLFGTSHEHGPVALKAFFSQSTGVAHRFDDVISDETAEASAINHPNIMKSFGHGEIRITQTTIVHVLISEVIPYTLSDLATSENNTISIESTLNMVRQMVAAMEYLDTEKHLIVTDLTPDNLGQREDGSWVLMDKGLLASPGTNREVGIDLLFTAPEIQSKKENLERSNAATPQSEVFSLALITWNGLTGKDIDENWRIYPSKSITQEKLSKDIYQVLQKAISEDPKDRYSTPTEFAKALMAAAKA